METITVIQDVSANFGAADAKGNAVPVPAFAAPPTWTSSDTTILTVAAAADGLSAVVTAVGKVGSADVTVSGTPTGATSAISGTAQVAVVAAAASSLVIGFGTPAIQTPGTPPPPAPPPAA